MELSSLETKFFKEILNAELDVISSLNVTKVGRLQCLESRLANRLLVEEQDRDNCQRDLWGLLP